MHGGYCFLTPFRRCYTHTGLMKFWQKGDECFAQWSNCTGHASLYHVIPALCHVTDLMAPMADFFCLQFKADHSLGW